MGLGSVFLVAVVLCAFSLSTTCGWRIYALSDGLDVWQGGAWSPVSLSFGDTRPTCCVKPQPNFFGNVGVGSTSTFSKDPAGNLYLRVMYTFLANVSIPASGVTAQFVLKLDTNTNKVVGARQNSYPYYQAAFDAFNNTYLLDVARITKIPTAEFNSRGQEMNQTGLNKDITSFRSGRAMVVAAKGVALYDVRSSTWKAMGAGIPYTVQRVVSDGTQLVALTFEDGIRLWRWNGTSEAWKRYKLTLTSGWGTPTISDLHFGGNQLFLVGNFDRINGVGARNVSQISFGAGGVINIKGIGMGLPGGEKVSIYARSATQIFVGGKTNGKKVVYEWKKDRAVPWDRIGELGFSSGDRPVFSLSVLD